MANWDNVGQKHLLRALTSMANGEYTVNNGGLCGCVMRIGMKRMTRTAVVMKS